MTVTFIAPKRGLYTAAGPDCCGQLLLAELGCREPLISDVLLCRDRPAKLLPPRLHATHKGDYGSVLVIGGAEGMAGAALLTGKAALAAGVGRVTIATHPRHASSMAASCPELMVHGVADLHALSALLTICDYIAIGPGLGVTTWGQDLLAAALESAKPLIVDADALNLLAGMPHQRPNWILTPHPGEAGRLLGQNTLTIQADRFAAARALQAIYGGYCVLKGCGSLIAGPSAPLKLVARGTPALAIPGSGDVLTGLLLGLLAQGLDMAAATEYGVWLHAALGENLGRQRSLLASDLINAIQQGLRC